MTCHVMELSVIRFRLPTEPCILLNAPEVITHCPHCNILQTNDPLGYMNITIEWIAFCVCLCICQRFRDTLGERLVSIKD